SVVAIVSTIVVTIMVVAWIVILKDKSAQPKDYVLLIQVTVVFFTAMMTAAITIAVARLQHVNALKIEEYRKNVGEAQDRLRADLAQVNALNIAEYQKNVGEAQDRLRADLAQVNALNIAEYQKNVGEAQDRLRADLAQAVQQSINNSTEQLKARLGQLVPKK